MSVLSVIEGKLANGINTMHLQVMNESHQHNVPQGSESHFNVTIVSEDFEGKSLLKRHRMINELLAEELQNLIHALALHTYTEHEWNEQNQQTPLSPPCLGGEK